MGILDHAIDFGFWNDDRRKLAFGLRRCFPRTLLILYNPILLFHRLIQGAVITALFGFAQSLLHLALRDARTDITDSGTGDRAAEFAVR